MLRAEVQLREPFDQLSLVAWALRRDGSVKLATRPGAGLKRRGAAGVIKRNGVRRKTSFCVRMDASRVYAYLDIEGAGS